MDDFLATVAWLRNHPLVKRLTLERFCSSDAAQRQHWQAHDVANEPIGEPGTMRQAIEVITTRYEVDPHREHPSLPHRGYIDFIEDERITGHWQMIYVWDVDGEFEHYEIYMATPL